MYYIIDSETGEVLHELQEYEYMYIKHLLNGIIPDKSEWE